MRGVSSGRACHRAGGAGPDGLVPGAGVEGGVGDDDRRHGGYVTVGVDAETLAWPGAGESVIILSPAASSEERGPGTRRAAAPQRTLAPTHWRAPPCQKRSDITYLVTTYLVITQLVTTPLVITLPTLIQSSFIQSSHFRHHLSSHHLSCRQPSLIGSSAAPRTGSGVSGPDITNTVSIIAGQVWFPYRKRRPGPERGRKPWRDSGPLTQALNTQAYRQPSPSRLTESQ